MERSEIRDRAADRPTCGLEGRRVLVVEDDHLVAQVLCDMLEDAGAAVVGPVGSVPEALAFIERADAAFSAILDINLHGAESYPIVDALNSRNIRFVFATGYGEDAIDGIYRTFPRCEKPFDQRKLIQALT